MSTYIKTKKEGGVFRITLARAEKRNAFTPEMILGVERGIQEANIDPKVKVILIDAEGPVFCAGMDLKAFSEEGTSGSISLGEVMAGAEKPTVALVQGPVYAGGFLLIAECTYVFAKEEVVFSLPEVKIGLFPFQVLVALLKVMPERKALQLCLDPRPFGVARAQQLGLVYDILDIEKVDELLSLLLANSRAAVQAGFQACRSLHHVKEGERYAYMIERLNLLKDSTTGLK
jgi:enoyl-CoA hydratase/carnithine racemase